MKIHFIIFCMLIGISLTLNQADATTAISNQKSETNINARNPVDQDEYLYKQYNRLSLLMTDFGVAAFDLFRVCSANPGGRLPEHVIRKIETYKTNFIESMQSHQKSITYISVDINEDELKQIALIYGEYLIHLTENYSVGKVKKFLYIIPSKMSQTLSLKKTIDQIAKVQYSLITHFDSLKKSKTLWNKIKSNLFFNVFTTKILPVVVKVAGIPLGIVASGFSFPIFEINPQPVPGDYQGAAKFMAKGAIKYVAPFFLTVGGLWTLGNFLTDLQIQEYEYRIKKKQEDADKLEVSKELEGKKILVENEVTLSQVFGHEVIKREKLGVMIDFLKHPIKYKSQRTKNVLTALFYGPPGTGKTLMARAVSGESKAPFVQVSADDFLSNNSKDKLLGIWELANSAARSAKSRSAIIYIDEVDFSVGNRAKGKLDSGKSRALSNLLAILDGIVKPNPYIHILIIMTTNHLDDLDSALLRPGRIDQKVFVGYPNTKTRHKLLSHLIPKESHININDIVEKSSGFSPAHIVSIVESANRQAILTGQKYPLLQQYLYELSQFQGDKNEDLLEIGDE